MGFSLSWLAVRGKDSAAVRSELGVMGPADTSPSRTRPCLQPTSRPAGTLSSGIGVISPRPSPWQNCPRAGKSSRVSSKNMSCTAARATGGTVGGCGPSRHDLQRGAGHLETEGTLPPVFAPVRDRLSAERAGKQDRVDYIFDVPVEVAKALTGFRHDEDIPGMSDEAYEILEKRGREKRWWEAWRKSAPGA